MELHVLESVQQMPLGQLTYSALYDLDISGLQEYSSRAECEVAQILKPGEADRFGIVLSAPTIGMAAGWRLATLLKTNVGPNTGPEVEVWLPRPQTLITFAAVTQHIASQAEKLIKAGVPVVAESEPGRSAGYKAFIVMDVPIISLYGPRPLLTMPGTISLAELMSR